MASSTIAFRHGSRSLCVALLAGAACTLTARAQVARGQTAERTVTGTVVDRHREPLAGAVVQVHSESTLNVVSYITDRTGAYVFKHLSPDDDYDVFATYRGSKSKRRHLSKFDSRPNRNFKLIIKLP